MVKNFELLRGASSHLVDIDVRDRPVQLVDNSSPGNQSEASDVPTMDASDDDVDLLPSFYAQPEKVLLSAKWRDAIRKEGQRFDGGGVKEFQNALVKFSAERGVSFKYVRNEKTRVIAECKMKDVSGCKWYVRGREVLGSGVFYIVKLVNVHSCGVVVRSKANSVI